MQGISWLAENRLASQEAVFCVELVDAYFLTYKVGIATLDIFCCTQTRCDVPLAQRYISGI
jgi:hypothetical protein